jgi:putative ABC transport system permease protein
MQTMNRIESEFVAPRRLTVLIAGIFAAVALILATVGVYGVLAYTVTQRNHEFGIRVALGAEGSDLFNLILKQGLKVAIVGLAIGWAGALALARVLRALLFGVTPTDPTVFLLVALVLMGVALLASCIPARRAAKVDPMVALKYE